MLNKPTPVWDNLWLSGSICRFPQTPVDLDVAVCTERERWFSPPSTRVLSLPLTNAELLKDEHRTLLHDAAEQAEQAIAANQKVIVRCKFGVERSALVVALVLMHLTHSPPERVVEYLRQCRDPMVLTGRDFISWLGVA